MPSETRRRGSVLKVFIEKADIQGDIITISKEDLHHLIKVLRVRDGDEVIACDGQYNYECEFETTPSPTAPPLHRGEFGLLRIKDKSVCENENRVNITIFQAVPKQAKMETIIQMCSELGVNRIVPIRTEFCVADLPDGKKLDRWQKIALESAKQCGRDKVLEVSSGAQFDEAVGIAKSECDLGFVCWEGEQEIKVAGLLRDYVSRNDVRIGIFVGSEGGFSQGEIARAGLPTVTLGKRILRTQTVAPVVSAMVLNVLDEI